MAAQTILNRDTDQFFLDCFTGEGGYLYGWYLPQHPMEEDEDYETRQQMSVYPNYVAKIVQGYSGYLWQRPPLRESSDLYARFVANADGQGTALSVLLQQAQRLAMVLGTVWLILDKPAGTPTSRADEGMPYLCFRLPSEREHTEQNSAGEITSITFREPSPDGRETYLRTFDLAGWRLTDSKGVAIEQGAYSFGRVPVVALHSQPPLLQRDLTARPWAFNICQQNWRVYRLRSEMDWLFSLQAFAMLYFPESDPQQREKLRKEGLVVGASTALIFDPTSGGRPGYAAPPPDPIKSYQDEIDAAIGGIYEAANLEYVGGAKVQQAATTTAYYFQQTNCALSDMAVQAERAERDIAWLVHAWLGAPGQESLIAYARDFSIANLQDELRQAMDALSIQVSPTFDQQVKKKVARSALGHSVSQKTMEDIDKEIEGNTDPYGDRVHSEAGGGLPPITTTSGATP